jgi:Tfp pilus assembly protein PilF
MGFDKAKAMRNAERYVAQGKIRSAIAEYRSVVENDPRDIATLNMLGDLYAKNAENKQAVNCYLQVADHYNTSGICPKGDRHLQQGLAHSARIYRSSAKLAELHKVKGSLAEAANITRRSPSIIKERATPRGPGDVEADRHAGPKQYRRFV